MRKSPPSLFNQIKIHSNIDLYLILLLLLLQLIHHYIKQTIDNTNTHYTLPLLFHSILSKYHSSPHTYIVTLTQPTMSFLFSGFSPERKSITPDLIDLQDNNANNNNTKQSIIMDEVMKEKEIHQSNNNQHHHHQDQEEEEEGEKEEYEHEEKTHHTREHSKRALRKGKTFLTRILSRGIESSESSAAASPPSSSGSSPSPTSSFKEMDDFGLGPLILHGYKDNTKHRLLDVELANNIRNLIPARLQLFDTWNLVYSMEQHGISLNTLYRHCDPEYQLRQLKKRKPVDKGFGDSIVSSMLGSPSSAFTIEPKRPQSYVLIIKDENNCKFGAYLNTNLKPMEHKRYYGNGDCFLWKCERYDPSTLNHNSKSNQPNDVATRFKAFVYTGINDNIIYSNHDFIAIGSSNGQNGIYIDKSLYTGVSYSCETFGNEILNLNIDHDAKMGRFKIMGLEIWRIGTIE